MYAAGRIDVSSVLESTVLPTRALASHGFSSIESGGVWRPASCKAQQKVVIIVPFRDRENQLKIFLNHMHGILQRQQLDYRIIVAEQVVFTKIVGDQLCIYVSSSDRLILQYGVVNLSCMFVLKLSPDTFNKASLMNAAFVEAQKLGAFDCVIFHDVDMLAEDDRNMYTCLQQPRHIGSHVDIFQYKSVT